jgi:putative NADPH-quinone reductase
MSVRVLIIDGHPDPDRARFCHALADAYAAGAADAGHLIERLTLAELELPPLRSAKEWDDAPSPTVSQCQEAIRRAQHLVIIYPLWLGTLPALLKGFFEQVFRPGFAISRDPRQPWAKMLKGKSARIVLTMGMPGLLYRWYFCAHGLKSLERNILGFCGIGPIRSTLIGGIGAIGQKKREAWLATLQSLGRGAS